MFRQAPPSFPQISHWYWYVIGVDPVHVPGLAVTVLPAPATPATPSPQTATAASTPRLRTIHFEKRTSLISTPSCLDQSSQPAWPLGRRLIPEGPKVLRNPCALLTGSPAPARERREGPARGPPSVARLRRVARDAPTRRRPLAAPPEHGPASSAPRGGGRRSRRRTRSRSPARPVAAPARPSPSSAIPAQPGRGRRCAAARGRPRPARP